MLSFRQTQEITGSQLTQYICFVCCSQTQNNNFCKYNHYYNTRTFCYCDSYNHNSSYNHRYNYNNKYNLYNYTYSESIKYNHHQPHHNHSFQLTSLHFNHSHHSVQHCSSRQTAKLHPDDSRSQTDVYIHPRKQHTRGQWQSLSSRWVSLSDFVLISWSVLSASILFKIILQCNIQCNAITWVHLFYEEYALKIALGIQGVGKNVLLLDGYTMWHF